MTGPVAAPAPPRWLLAGLAIFGLAGAVASVAVALASETLVRPVLQAFLINWITIPYLLSGLIAWWRRPASRLGPLMVAVGYTMALTSLQWSHQPVLHSLGHLVDLLPAALFLHVFLAYPTGRLRRRAERVLVVCCYTVTMTLQLAKIFLGADPET